MKHCLESTWGEWGHHRIKWQLCERRPKIDRTIYRGELKGLYVVGRIFFLFLLYSLPGPPGSCLTRFTNVLVHLCSIFNNNQHNNFNLIKRNFNETWLVNVSRWCVTVSVNYRRQLVKLNSSHGWHFFRCKFFEGKEHGGTEMCKIVPATLR